MENANPDNSRSRRFKVNHSPRSKAVRLKVERLECRRLLAGLNVSVYIDQNLSGNYEPSQDIPAANRIVYIDLNKSGTFNDGEPIAITNQLGNGLFSELQVGDYSIGLLTNEQYQRLNDPVTISTPSVQPVSPELRTLSDDRLTDLSLVHSAIKSARNLDFLVELGHDRGFVGTKQLGDATLVELIDQQSQLVDSMVVLGVTQSLTADVTSGQVALATDRATHVLAATEGRLVAKAVLADAAAPLAFLHNRLVSADRSDLRGWIAWNTKDWLPIRRERLADSPLLDVAFSDDGNSVYALSEGKLYSARWIGTTAPVKIKDGDSHSELRLGVRVVDDVPPISIDPLPIRQASENTVDRVDLRSLLGQPNGMNFWFALGNNARRGLVEVSPEGKVVYTPQQGFAGRDQATIQVYDGLTSSQLTLDWNITETNKPPIGIIIDIPEFSENTPVGSELGFVTVIDPNAGAAYRVTTSDPRFRVEHGRVILNGIVDFEQESLITLDFFAIDEQESFSITATATLSVVNVIEPPSSIFLSNSTVNEKTTNAVVGQISFLNPDREADYEISVSDTRFVVQGEQLIVVERLDHRDGESIVLTLTVTDRNAPSAQATQQFSITVNPVNDAPRDIAISSLKVPELTPGGIVGRLTTSGIPNGETVRYEVSDERFEVIDGVLKLRPDAEVVRSIEPNITLSVTAIGLSGASTTVTFPLVVIPPRSPWHNPFNPPDVNGDGRVNALDALQIINYLNSNGSGPVPPPPRDPDGNGEPPPIRPDVNGDGRVTALDALLVINLLNSRLGNGGQAGSGGGNSGSSPEGEAGPETLACPQASLSQTSFVIYEDENAESRRRNSRIDSELELLLDQLASDKHR